MPRLRLLLTLSCAGCCGSAVRPLAPLPRPTLAVPVGDRLDLLERLRAEESRVATLTVAHSIRLASTDGRSSGTLRGILAVRRPDAYRLRLVGPAGITAMDLTYRAGRFLLLVPARDVRLAGDRSTPPERLRGLPVEGLARAFLERWSARPDEVREDGRWTLMVFREPSGRRLVFVDRRTGLVHIDSTFREGREEVRLEYDRYRSVSGARLPFAVRFALVAEGLTAAIEVERYRVNPTLPEAAFELADIR